MWGTMKRQQVIGLFILLSALSFAQEQIPLLYPRTLALVASQTGTTTLQNFSGNQALYTVSNGPLFQTFFTSWIYCNPFTTDVPALFALDSNNQPSAALSDQLASNGFGAGFTAGLGWSGKGIGLGFEFIVGQYTKTITYGESEGLIQGKLSIIIGYGFTIINTDGFSLQLGADVRPYIRFVGQSTESDIFAFVAMMSGRTSEWFMNIPVYAGASAELNAGVLLTVGKIASVGLTAHGFTPLKTYQGTTIGNLFSSFNASQASEQQAFMSIPQVACGASIHLLKLLGIGDSTDMVLSAELADAISALQNLDTFFSYTGAGLTLSLFNGIIQGAIGYKNAALSYGLAIRAWFFTLEALLFTEYSDATDAKQGFSFGMTIRF